MNKKTIVKTAIITSALIVATSITAFAQNGTVYFGNGYGYLFGSTDNSAILRKATAGTVPGEGESSLTLLTTTYDNGDESTARDGITVGSTRVCHDWDYADGFESNHKMLRGGLGYAQRTLSY